MANMLDYINNFGKERLTSTPFSDVDNLILSDLAYVRYEDAKRLLPASLESIYEAHAYACPEMRESLLKSAAESQRLKDAVLTEYESILSEQYTLQFSAVTFLLPDGTAYVAYRGTDNTLVGWKEDFNLSFITPIPAQTEARKYLSRIGRILKCPLRVGGHSKGGNLAVYASALCASDIQDRIINVYNNDGPGHDISTIASDGYKRIAPRIRTFIPRSSIVGMLLEHTNDYLIVESDAHGLFQHHPYSWLIEDQSFIITQKHSDFSYCMNESIRRWLTGMSPEKRRRMIDMIYNLLNKTNVKTIKELKSSARNLIPIIIAAADLSFEDKKEIIALTGQFMKIALDQYSSFVWESAVNNSVFSGRDKN